MQLRMKNIAQCFLMVVPCGQAKLGSSAVRLTVCRGKVSTSSFLLLTLDYRKKEDAAGESWD